MYELHFQPWLLRTRLVLRHQICSVFSYLRWLPREPHATNLRGVDGSQIA